MRLKDLVLCRRRLAVPTVMVVAGISEGHVRFAECGLSVHKEPALTGSPAGASDWWMC